MRLPPLPIFPAGDDADLWHGVSVPDPYRGLEAVSTEPVQAWVAAQLAATGAWFDRTDAYAHLQRRARSMPAPTLVGPATVSGSRIFYLRSVEPDLHPVLWVQDGAGGVPVAIVDPNADGRGMIARSTVCPSPSGRSVAYGVVQPGSDLVSIHVFDLEAGQDRATTIEPTVLPVMAWHPDESGLYYNALRGVHRHAGKRPVETGLYFHQFGSAAPDRLEFACEWDGGWIPKPSITRDGRYLCVAVTNLFTHASSLWARRLEAGASFERVVPPGEGFLSFAESVGETFIVGTTTGAPHGHVLEFVREQSGYRQGRTLLPESALMLGRTPYLTGRLDARIDGALYVAFFDGGRSVLLRFTGNSEVPPERIDLPAFCTINALNVLQGKLLIQAESLAFPEQLFLFDESSRQLVPCDAAAAGSVLQLAWQTVQARAKDGTIVPASLARPVGQAPGPQPTLLFVYGGLGAPITSRFREEFWLALTEGYNCALAHVRGGGEFGRAWHQAATGAAKQRTFDDLYAIAEALIEEGVTSAAQLVIKGESFGGLAVSVAYAQRPDLFAGVIASVPAVDLLRQLTAPGGDSMRADLGDPAADAGAFATIRHYAPLQNVGPAPRKPGLLYVVGEKDINCLPGYAYKFVQAAQACALPDQPVVLQVMAGCAHSGWPQAPKHQAAAMEIAFMSRMTRTGTHG